MLRKKVHIHPVFWIVFGTGVLTGHFWDVTAIFFIVMMHELGHALAALFLGWRLTSIELLPFGGVAKVDESGTRPFQEEFIVTLSGPMQHLWLPFVSFLLLMTPYWNATNHEMFLEKNWMILLFNLFPIWPLDGGKLLLIVLSRYFPYRRAYRLALLSSFLFLMLLTLWVAFHRTILLNYFVIALFLLVMLIKEWRQQRYVFMRFLLERWQHSALNELKSMTVSVPSDMALMDVVEMFYKDRHHQIKIQGKNEEYLITEKHVLNAFFNGNYYNQAIGKLL
ncbi:M50 family metallopeptidase [Pullulanibacillus camelliae]|uniref:M50 family metallopeptidase n=1 Tax=Pullulanibacillus camelliae TaxID=1707096 RepID=UPI001667B1BD|nr:M50 family metallopeptidase [Pullulanibacillus camelliae]